MSGLVQSIIVFPLANILLHISVQKVAERWRHITLVKCEYLQKVEAVCIWCEKLWCTFRHSSRQEIAAWWLQRKTLYSVKLVLNISNVLKQWTFKSWKNYFLSFNFKTRQIFAWKWSKLSLMGLEFRFDMIGLESFHKSETQLGYVMLQFGIILLIKPRPVAF